MSLLGLDIGSSGCRGVVFDHEGRILAAADRKYSAIPVRPGFMEMDPDTFWESAVLVIKELTEQTSDDPVEAVAVSSHGETIIPVDSNGNAVSAAILNSDNRATVETEQWLSSIGREKIYEITGLPLHSMFSLNKIMWLKIHQPEVYGRTAQFLSAGDFILRKLGLPPVTDYSLASRTMAFDINKRAWSKDLLSEAGVSEENLGEIVPAGTAVGRLIGSTARSLGLPSGTVISPGGHDQPCGALGAGVWRSGDIFDSAGSFECLTLVSDEPMNTPEALRYNLNSYCHVVEDRYVTLSFFPSGIAAEWFINEIFDGDKTRAQSAGVDFFEYMGVMVQKQSEGPTGLNITPHLIGSCSPNWDPKATALAAGFTPGHTRYHLYKAIYEGIACELAENVAALEHIAGSFNEFCIGGGTSRSDFAVQLRADICGKKINRCRNNEAVCQGAAMLAGTASGAYNSTEEACEAFRGYDASFIPVAASTEAYRNQLKKYRLLYKSLAAYRNYSE